MGGRSSPSKLVRILSSASSELIRRIISEIPSWGILHKPPLGSFPSFLPCVQVCQRRVRESRSGSGHSASALTPALSPRPQVSLLPCCGLTPPPPQGHTRRRNPLIESKSPRGCVPQGGEIAWRRSRPLSVCMRVPDRKPLSASILVCSVLYSANPTWAGVGLYVLTPMKSALGKQESERERHTRGSLASAPPKNGHEWTLPGV